MKLRKRFKDVVATERIVLHAVESDHVVCCYCNQFLNPSHFVLSAMKP